MMNINSPCKACTARCESCHDTCEQYQAFVVYRKQARQWLDGFKPPTKHISKRNILTPANPGGHRGYSI